MNLASGSCLWGRDLCGGEAFGAGVSRVSGTPRTGKRCLWAPGRREFWWFQPCLGFVMSAGGWGGGAWVLGSSEGPLEQMASLILSRSHPYAPTPPVLPSQTWGKIGSCAPHLLLARALGAPGSSRGPLMPHSVLPSPLLDPGWTPAPLRRPQDPLLPAWEESLVIFLPKGGAQLLCVEKCCEGLVTFSSSQFFVSHSPSL